MKIYFINKGMPDDSVNSYIILWISYIIHTSGLKEETFDYFKVKGKLKNEFFYLQISQGIAPLILKVFEMRRSKTGHFLKLIWQVCHTAVMQFKGDFGKIKLIVHQ